MDLFTLAALVFDLAIKISGHNKVVVELGDRIKRDELKNNDEKKETLINSPFILRILIILNTKKKSINEAKYLTVEL